MFITFYSNCTEWYGISTVNSEIFARILLLRIALKDIFATLKISKFTVTCLNAIKSNFILIRNILDKSLMSFGLACYIKYIRSVS